MAGVLSLEPALGEAVFGLTPFTLTLIKQLDGSQFGGVNCNCASEAMAEVFHRRGVRPAYVRSGKPWRPTGASVRASTGDRRGGTTLVQVDSAGIKDYHIDLDVRYRYDRNVFRSQITAGRGAILQGAASAMRGTKYQASATFGGNHSIFIAAHKPGWFLGFDPLADGRRRGIAKGPMWYPETMIWTFAARLNIGGRILGPGIVYTSMTADINYLTNVTVPTTTKTTLRYGGVAHRFNYAAKVDHARQRSNPRDLGAHAIIRSVRIGTRFAAYQRTTTGALVNGSRVWYGSQNGLVWMHSSVLKRV